VFAIWLKHLNLVSHLNSLHVTSRPSSSDNSHIPWCLLQPLAYAAAGGHLQAARILLQAGAYHSPVSRLTVGLSGAAPSEQHSVAPEPLVELVGSDMGVYKSADVGSMPLLYASEAGHVEVVKLLLASGAPVNALSSVGTTPLILAAKHLDVVRFALKFKYMFISKLTYYISDLTNTMFYTARACAFLLLPSRAERYMCLAGEGARGARRKRERPILRRDHPPHRRHRPGRRRRRRRASGEVAPGARGLDAGPRWEWRFAAAFGRRTRLQGSRRFDGGCRDFGCACCLHSRRFDGAKKDISTS